MGLRESTDLHDCRQRVLDAQCEVFPRWANGACLLVPLIEGHVIEAGIELRAHHVVALLIDLESIRSALSSMSNRQRPKIRNENFIFTGNDMAQQEEELSQAEIQNN